MGGSIYIYIYYFYHTRRKHSRKTETLSVFVGLQRTASFVVSLLFTITALIVIALQSVCCGLIIKVMNVIGPNVISIDPGPAVPITRCRMKKMSKKVYKKITVTPDTHEEWKRCKEKMKFRSDNEFVKFLLEQ